MLLIEKGGFVSDPELQRFTDIDEVTRQTLASLASRHLGGLASLHALKSDTTVYPDQRTDVIGLLRSGPVNLHDIRALCLAAYPPNDLIISAFQAEPRLLDSIIDLQRAGERIGLATDHKLIEDTPIVGNDLFYAILDHAFNQRGYTGYNPKMTIITSKIVPWLGVFGNSATKALATSSNVAFTIPPSVSVRESDLSDAYRNSFNYSSLTGLLGIKPPETQLSAEVADEIEQQWQNWSFLNYALPGATNKRLSRIFGVHRRRPSVHMHPIANGTIDHIMSKTHTLPISVILGKKPEVRIGQIHDPLKDPSEAHNIMFAMAHELTDLTGIQHIYHPTINEFKEATRDEPKQRRG